MKTRIIIADDHKIVREGLRSLLEKELAMEVLASADNGRKAVQLAKELRPDLVIIDITMPDLNGIEATKQLLRDTPGLKVIALSMHSDKKYVGEMLRAGASAYLLKDCAVDELERAIQVVRSGRVYISPDVAGVVVEGMSQTSQPVSQLTIKEREVLQLLAEGHSTKEIAHRLSVSAATIDTHRQHIMEKLNLYNVAELTKYAIREGLTSLER
jgi:two-component system, NarL family, response regulator NreC